ncbi:transposon Tf2-9 polyprotein [Trichonephila clavata]|uniref:Transposon Tf2-9 polyprotein n=1 Tax=Trichonephila clavata TaxID=2740835 RepID=A0A8X6GMT7_TRICU|nr:transposon Tf2-9 polyprotein [Trichonephila clavata]
MAFLAKGKKADLVNVCEELGENVPPNSRVPDIKHIILESKNFNEEAVRIMLDRIIGERLEEAIEYPDVDLQKFTRQVKIGDFVVTALLDTGSVRNLIRFDVYKRMNPKTKLWRESTVLTGLGQGQVKTLGSFRHVAEVDGHVCRLDFQVVPSAALKFEAIIGSAFLAHAPCPFHEEKVKPESPDWIFNISKKEEQDELDLRHIQNAEIACRVEDMVSSYQPKKTESTDVSMKIILEDEIPVYQRARRLSFPERQEVNKQIDEWIRDGIIRPSSSD